MRYPSYYPLSSFIKCIHKIKYPLPNLESLLKEFMKGFTPYSTANSILFDGKDLDIREDWYSTPLSKKSVSQLLKDITKYSRKDFVPKITEFLEYTFPTNSYTFSDNTIVGKCIGSNRYDITRQDIIYIYSKDYNLPQGINSKNISFDQIADTEFDDGTIVISEKLNLDIIDIETALSKKLLKVE